MDAALQILLDYYFKLNHVIDMSELLCLLIISF